MAETGLLTVLRGLPGSGKTTYAQREASEGEAVVLSRDSLRDMLHPTGHGGVLDGAEESIISDTLRAMAVRLLGEGKEVVIDATNLRDKYVREWLTLAHGRGHSIDIVDFRAEPLETCLENNANRERQVPEHVIRDMHQRFIKGRDLVTNNEEIVRDVLAGTPAKPELEPAPEYDLALPDAYIWDLDGTLAIKHPDRDIYDGSKAYLDTVNHPVADVLEILHDLPVQGGGPHRIYCTGRGEWDRAVTEAWLERHFNFDPAHGDLLLMRQNKGRADWKEKLDLYNEHIRGKYNVLGVWDDRQQVVEMWRSLGLQVFQVAEGSF